MPPPPKKPYWFDDTAGLSAEKIVGVDHDYLYFIRHIRLEDASYVLEIPSTDDPSTPVVARSSEPLTGLNVEAPNDGSEHDDLQGAPSPVAMGSSAAAEAPSGATTPTTMGGAVAVEADKMTPLAMEPAWYDSIAGIDESYRLFLKRHSEAKNHAPSALEMGDLSASLEEAKPVDNSEERQVDKEMHEKEAEEEHKKGHEKEEEEEGLHEEIAEEEHKEGHEKEEEKEGLHEEKAEEEHKEGHKKEEEDKRQEEMVEEGEACVNDAVEKEEVNNKDDNEQIEDAVASLLLLKNAAQGGNMEK